MSHEWGGQSPRLGQRVHPPPGCPSRGGGPDELIGEGHRGPRLRAPPLPARQRGPRCSSQARGAHPGQGPRPPAPPASPSGNGPEFAKSYRPAAGLGAPAPTGPQIWLAAPRPVVEGRSAPDDPHHRGLPAQDAPSAPRRARTGGPATWQPGGAPSAGPSARRGLRAPRRPRPAPRPARLTQKTKLKTKSRYLMHLVQPSTPMAARAAGGLRGAGRCGATGRGAWGPGERPRTGTAAGGCRSGWWRKGRVAREAGPRLAR